VLILSVQNKRIKHKYQTHAECDEGFSDETFFHGNGITRLRTDEDSEVKAWEMGMVK